VRILFSVLSVLLLVTLLGLLLGSGTLALALLCLGMAGLGLGIAAYYRPRAVRKRIARTRWH